MLSTKSMSRDGVIGIALVAFRSKSAPRLPLRLRNFSTFSRDNQTNCPKNSMNCRGKFALAFDKDKSREGKCSAK